MDLNDPEAKYCAIERIQQELTQDPRLRSPRTRRRYYYDLRDFETFRAGRPLRKMLVEHYLASLQDLLEPTTINRKLAAIRWYARRVADLLFEDADIDPGVRDRHILQLNRVTDIRDLPKPEGNHRPGRFIEEAEFQLLLRVCDADSSIAGVRDGAMFCFGWHGGPRRDEIGGSTTEQLHVLGEAELMVVVVGKGRKPRELHLKGEAARWINRWMSIRGKEPGALFCPIDKHDHLQIGKRLSGEALRRILDGRIQAAEIRPFTWHDFRRTFISRLLNITDLANAQDLAGHSSSNTTAKYDRRGETSRKQAIYLLQEEKE